MEIQVIVPCLATKCLCLTLIVYEIVSVLTLIVYKIMSMLTLIVYEIVSVFDIDSL